MEQQFLQMDGATCSVDQFLISRCQSELLLRSFLKSIDCTDHQLIAVKVPPEAYYEMYVKP